MNLGVTNSPKAKKNYLCEKAKGQFFNRELTIVKALLYFQLAIPTNLFLPVI